MRQNQRVSNVGGVRKVPAANGVLFEVEVFNKENPLGYLMRFLDSGHRLRPLGDVSTLGRDSRLSAWNHVRDARGHH